MIGKNEAFTGAGRCWQVCSYKVPSTIIAHTPSTTAYDATNAGIGINIGKQELEEVLSGNWKERQWR